MEIKKSPKADLEKSRSIFLEMGLAFVLLAILVAFEWPSSDVEIKDLGQLAIDNFEAEEVPITRQEQPEPPKMEQPKPQQVIEQLEIVEDDTELEEELEIKDTEVDDNTKVEIVEVEEEDEVEEAEIFFVVEDMPEFPGGQLELRKYIAEHVEYPEIARENEIQGRVYVQFVVNENGKVENAKVVRGVDPALDKAALKVINSLPAWKPGKQRGKAVKVSFTVPINFVLN